MMKNRLRIPMALPISALIVFLLGLAARAYLNAQVDEAELRDNAILNNLPLLLTGAGILLAFITLLVAARSWLNQRISVRLYGLIENVLIAGIVLGVVGMFQYWSFAAFGYALVLLLAATVGFIFWCQVEPKPMQEWNRDGQEEELNHE